MNPQQLKIHQRKEKLLSGLLMGISLAAPVVFTYLMGSHIHRALASFLAFSVLMLCLWILLYRSHVSRQVKRSYESLEVGLILARKARHAKKFIITKQGYTHYYLKCLDTGEQLLISRQRAHDDFILSESA